MREEQLEKTQALEKRPRKLGETSKLVELAKPSHAVEQAAPTGSSKTEISAIFVASSTTRALGKFKRFFIHGEKVQVKNNQ